MNGSELYIFARFHAREGMEEKVAAAMQEMLPPVRSESGCMSIEVFRSTRDKRLFCLHSRWIDEAAFDLHATLPHTQHFIETVETLVDHPLDVVRTRLFGNWGQSRISAIRRRYPARKAEIRL